MLAAKCPVVFSHGVSTYPGRQCDSIALPAFTGGGGATTDPVSLLWLAAHGGIGWAT